MEGVNPKNQRFAMALLHKEEDDHDHEDKRRNMAHTRQNLKRHIPLVSL